MELRVEAVDSNIERDRVALALLGELQSAWLFPRAAQIERLLQRVWLFHEDPRVTGRMRVGAKLLQTGRLSEAERVFEEATVRDPRYAEAWSRLAAVRAQMGDDEAALDSAKNALALEPAHLGALHGMGQVLMKARDFGAAGAAFRAVRSVHPASLQALASEFGAEALQRLRAADTLLTPLAPHASTLAVTAMVLLSILGAGRAGPGGAEVPWLQATAQIEEPLLDSRARRVPLLEGVPLLKVPLLEVLPKALLLRCCREAPGGGVDMSRATRVVIVTRTGAPLEELSRAVGALSSNVDRLELSMRLLDELGAAEQPARAESISQLLWKTWFFHQNGVVAAAVERGSALMAEGDLQGAAQSFQDAANRDPRYAEAWNRLATVHWLMGDLPRSLVEIDRTLELEPRHFGALAGRGLVLLDLGRYSEAAEAFREAQEVMPASKALQQNLSDAEAAARAS